MCPTNEYGEYIRPKKTKTNEFGEYTRPSSNSTSYFNDLEPSLPRFETTTHVSTGKTPTVSEIISVVVVIFITLAFIFNLSNDPYSSNTHFYEQSVFTSTNLNARAGPSNSSEIKHVFETGTNLIILERKDSWIKVTPVDNNLKSLTGEVWVHQSYVEASKLVRTIEYLNARANSNSRSEILFVFQPDTELITLSRLNNWYLVEPVDQDLKKQVNRAWVYGDYITDR